MRYATSILLMLLVCVALGRVWAADPYTLVDTRTYDVINRYIIENTSGGSAEDVVVKLLVGGTDQSTYQQKIRYRVSPGGATLSTDALGNIFATVKLANFRPHEKRTLTVEKYILNSGITYPADIYTQQADYAAFSAITTNRQYLLPSAHIESDAPAIKNEVLKLTQVLPAARAKEAFAKVNALLTYDTNEAYAHQGALHALQSQRGVCTEFAGLLVALCRASGIPARVVSGYWVHRDMTKGVPVDVSADRHAWAEFYLPTYGWVPAEPSMIYTNGQQRVLNDDYFAHIGSLDRHFIWAYGLETEHEVNINLAFTVADQNNTDCLRITLGEESITWIDDNPVIK